MKRFTITLAALALVAMACQQSGPTTPSAGSIGTPLFSNNSGVVHRVSAGGHDLNIAENTDANFSLVAIEYGDGSMSGQWTDQFGQQDGGFHAEVNCLRVVGNQAWISGVITSGSVPGFDLTGLPVITRVQDVGNSANDPPDRISFSFIGNPTPCTATPNLILLPMTDGQVTVQ